MLDIMGNDPHYWEYDSSLPYAQSTKCCYVGDFFTGESGKRLLPDCGIPHDPFDYPYSSSDDEPSTPIFESEESFPHSSSAETVVTDSTTSIHSLSLTKFCGLVEAHQPLQHVEIFSAECYTELIGSHLHRFIVLELRAPGKETIFLRIDRRRLREYSMWNVRETVASMPTQDSAQLSPTKVGLVEGGTLETQTTPETLPTLGELALSLHITDDEVRRYQHWPENSWLFAYSIMQRLGAPGGDSLDLPDVELARDIREQISERMRLLYHMPMPLTLTALLSSLHNEYPKLQILKSALTLSKKWDEAGDAALSGKAKGQLVNLHHTLRQVLGPDQERRGILSIGDMCALAAQDLSLVRLAHKYNVSDSEEGLFSSLRTFGHYLTRMGRVSEAQTTFEEAIHIGLRLYSNNPERHQEGLVSLMQLHTSLPGEGLLTKKLACWNQLIGVNRWLYELSPTTERRTHLTQTMDTYGAMLSEVVEDYYDGLSSVWGELVAADFGLYRANPDKQRRQLLVASLHEYSDSLDDTHRTDKICTALRTLVNTDRDLHDESPSPQSLERFANSAGAYAEYLSEAGRIVEASAAWDEHIVAQGKRYAQKPAQCRGRLLSSLRSQCDVLNTLGRADEMCLSWKRLVHLDQSLHLNDPSNPRIRNNLSASLREYINTLDKTRRREEKLQARRDMVIHHQQVYGALPLPSYRDTIFEAMRTYEELAEYMGQADNVHPEWEAIVGLDREQYASDASAQNYQYLIESLGYLSSSLSSARLFTRANLIWREQRQLRAEKRDGREPPRTRRDGMAWNPQTVFRGRSLSIHSREYAQPSQTVSATG